MDTTVCRPMVPEPQTTAFDDERHARLRALSIADQGFLLAPARKLLGPNRRGTIRRRLYRTLRAFSISPGVRFGRQRVDLQKGETDASHQNTPR